MTDQGIFHPSLDGRWIWQKKSNGYVKNYIVINSKRHIKNVPFILSVIAHETFHFVHYNLNDRGLKFSPDSEEAFSYLQQYLFECCAEHILPVAQKRLKELKKK